MLQNIKELKPLFQKFGVSAMSDVLEQELSGKQTRTHSKPVKAKKIRQTNISHAKRTFNLLPSAQNATQQHQNLPQLSIHEGLVRLDNEVEPRATVDAANRTVQWSRKLPNGQYEHGYVELRDHGMSGAGAILVNQNADQATMPTSDNAQIVPFNTVKANVTVSDSPVQAPLQHTQVSKKGTLTCPHQTHLYLLLAGSDRYSLTRLTSLEIHKSTGSTQFARTTKVTKYPPSVPTNIIGTNRNCVKFDGFCRSDTRSAFGITSTHLIDGQDYYNMTLDRAVWPPGQTVTSPSSPVTFGMVAFATYHSGGAGGYSMGILTVPILDQLLAAINQIDGSTPGSTPLKCLYSSEITLDDDGNMMGDVKFDQAAWYLNTRTKTLRKSHPCLVLPSQKH